MARRSLPFFLSWFGVIAVLLGVAAGGGARGAEGLFRNLVAPAAGNPARAVTVKATLSRAADGAPELTVTLNIGPGTHLYAREMKLTLPAGVTAEPAGGDRPGAEEDTGAPIFTGDVRLLYRLRGDFTPPLAVGVTYQGCTGAMCFLPRTEEFSLDFMTAAPGAAPAGVAPSAPADTGTGAPAPAPAAAWEELAEHFTVARTAVGYQDKDTFLGWLQGRERNWAESLLDRVLGTSGLWAVALLLLPLGALLNLTPCVLPMVPITLGILGASSAEIKEKGRGRGFSLGLLYGAGMALVYGVLGLVVVLTGSRFGALNSSPWFNFAVAAVFVALALAMFDIWALDFTRFNRVKVDNRKNPYCGAFLLGGLTALLAGACVAPVLVWVLLLAADLYAKGNVLGMALPFLLGAGMALPWPFLAAGVSRLPRPGTWMQRVKQAFGVLILLVGVYYGVLGYRLLAAAETPSGATPAAGAAAPGWHPDLPAAFRAAEASGRPLFLDFGGVACKACATMKMTTLRDPAVMAELDKMEKVEFMADGTDAFTQAVVRRYGVMGLPTYVILQKR